jgi:cytochrome c oxidase cbb3-type subunit 3
MSLARLIILGSVLVVAGAAIFLFWGARQDRAQPAAAASLGTSLPLTDIVPGAQSAPPPAPGAYRETAQALSQGQQLYSAFNCIGCHHYGGGGIGPALMDDTWIYGSDPESIYRSIAEGRPNGMPAFGGHIPEQQIWQIVTYVRSLAALVPASIRPSRDDHMQTTPPQTLQDAQVPKSGDPSAGAPPP